MLFLLGSQDSTILIPTQSNTPRKGQNTKLTKQNKGDGLLHESVVGAVLFIFSVDCGHQRRRSDAMVTVGDDFVASFDDLSVDVLANVFAFLAVEDNVRSRRINKKTMEAVRKTTVPLSDFCVGSIDNYSAMNVVARAMPNLQQIMIGHLEWGHKYSDGEDPDEELAAQTAHQTTHDIEIISNFRKLRILNIKNVFSRLNGRYPFLFNFPLLQKLSIKHCKYLKWDLGMLVRLPLLKELECWENSSLTGNIISLRVLKDTLEKVEITDSKLIEGNFMDLADFPHLKELNLRGSAVTGDIRGIGSNDFSLLESLSLPKRIYGAKGYEFQRITDAPDVARAVYLLKKKMPALDIKYWHGKLSEGSPDWYGSWDKSPLYIRFIEAGSRIGYRWITWNGSPCEVNWLDPEPDRRSSDYGEYIEELEEIESQVTMYRGFSHRPPTEEEWNRLIEDYESSRMEYDDESESSSDE